MMEVVPTNARIRIAELEAQVAARDARIVEAEFHQLLQASVVGPCWSKTDAQKAHGAPSRWPTRPRVPQAGAAAAGASQPIHRRARPGAVRQVRREAGGRA